MNLYGPSLFATLSCNTNLNWKETDVKSEDMIIYLFFIQSAYMLSGCSPHVIFIAA